jgi:lysophospholipase L1-like esterase
LAPGRFSAPVGYSFRKLTRRSHVAIALAALCAVAGSTASPAAATRPTSSSFDYYISLGDSYAAGNQPTPSAWAHRDTNGFAYQVVELARAKGYRFELRNFGCGGATTASVLQEVGCFAGNPGPDTTSYPTQTQEAAATRFISRHRGRIGLVSVSIGGNDLLSCDTAAQFLSCAKSVLKVVKRNLAVLLGAVRRSAGPGVPIVGTTYPDIFLGSYLSPSRSQKKLAILSVGEFRSLFNPALNAAYSRVSGSFVDVTKATGAYTPFSQTTSYGRSGKVPVAVADVCVLTYYCRLGDVHPTTRGYQVMARLIVASLPAA